jgi:hypothetical protein
MSDRELRPVETEQGDLPVLIEWARGWWIKHQGALREENVRELLMAYAAMDDRARDLILRVAASQAEHWPAIPPAPPALYLVRTGTPQQPAPVTLTD